MNGEFETHVYEDGLQQPFDDFLKSSHLENSEKYQRLELKCSGIIICMISF